ncbi:heavy metal-associated isoprenylated plant protein 32-like isoform X2 [Phragmites australis]|nr:heavy metal-associated isoprenylated plant protein 32-like isoform X2 [Phragmites australis]
MSTIVMRVDLDCDKCYKKIRKVLCKLQDKVSIRTISYDERSKTVTVSGPFDADEVAERLTSDAGKVITDIHVVGGNQKPGAKPPKPGKVNGHGHGQGQGHSGGGGHGGGKPEKKHVKFDDMDDDFNDEPADRHAHHGHGKPKIVTATPAAARLEAPGTGPSMSMSAAAPVRMPAMAPQQQATVVPSIWPVAPEWGYSAPQYGGWGVGGPPAGGYYGGPAVHGHGGYGPYVYGRNPYGPQYYDEEPGAGCSVM